MQCIKNILLNTLKFLNFRNLKIKFALKLVFIIFFPVIYHLSLVLCSSYGNQHETLQTVFNVYALIAVDRVYSRIGRHTH